MTKLKAWWTYMTWFIAIVPWIFVAAPLYRFSPRFREWIHRADRKMK